MTKKTRFYLFIVLLTLFLLVSPLAVFYSQGYRFDLERKRVSQTGAFYFKVLPKIAEIYLEDKLVKKTDFLFGTAFIDNLLPKKYKIEIKKEGYQSWQKNLEIKEKFTTEIKNIFLVPENIKFEVLENDIEDFNFAPDGKKVVLKKETPENWALTLFDLRNYTQSPLLTSEDILKKGEKTEDFDLIWSADSKKNLIKVITKKPKYFILEIDRERSLIPLDFLGENINEVSLDPENSQRIFFIKKSTEKNGLFSVAYGKKEVSGPLLEDIISYQAFNGNLYWLSKEGFLVQSDFSGKRIRNFNLQPISLKKNAEYKIMVFPEEKIFFRENNNLYFFDEKNQSLEKNLENVKDEKIAPDLKKVAYFSDNEIWVLFLKDIEDEQPQRKEREKLFLTRFSEKIDNVFWWTSHYLIFNAGNIIKIAEIDDRDRINIYDLTEFKDPPKESKLPTGHAKIFWSKFDKKLYILSEENLYSSEKLIR